MTASNLPTITIATTDMLSKPPAHPAPHQASCYLCDEENPGDFHATTKFLDSCLLCARAFCPLHKGTFDHVCNINHSTYYHEHPDQPDLYPSIGEREKMLFVEGSPTDGDMATSHTLPEMNEVHLSDEEREKLIEVKDVVGADIAV